MGDKSYKQMLFNEYMALTDVKEPNIPVEVLVAEAKVLGHLAKKDWDFLSIRKLERSLVDTIDLRANALQEAESEYTYSQFDDPELAKQFAELVSEATNLRARLINDFYYAFDGDEALTDVVRDISEGGSYADLVQDMSDLELLGEKHPDKVEAAGVDTSLLKRCGELKITLGDLLAQTTAEKMERSPEKDMRDRAYTYLYIAMNKIRKAGKSVFFDDPEHASRYASAYLRSKRRRSERKKEQEAASI